MNHDESRRKIVDALGLSPHAATLLIGALDERYVKKLTMKDVRYAMGAVAQRHGYVDPLGPELGSVRMVPEVVPVAPGETIRWGVLDSDGDWLEATSYYVLRATNEAIAAELNTREDRRTHTSLRYEARPVLADGSPGPAPHPVGCTCFVCLSYKKLVTKHCLGNDCADKAACECLCDRCNP